MSASSCLTDVWTPSLDLLSGELSEPALDLIDDAEVGVRWT